MMRAARILALLLACPFIPGSTLAQSVVIGGNSSIGQCDTTTYSVSLINTSGGTIEGIQVLVDLANLPGFTFVEGSSQLAVDGVPFCSSDPVVAGSKLAWDVDSLCATSLELEPGQLLDVSFSLHTSCSAVSGNTRSNHHVGRWLGGCDPRGSRTPRRCRCQHDPCRRGRRIRRPGHMDTHGREHRAAGRSATSSSRTCWAPVSPTSPRRRRASTTARARRGVRRRSRRSRSWIREGRSRSRSPPRSSAAPASTPLRTSAGVAAARRASTPPCRAEPRSPPCNVGRGRPGCRSLPPDVTFAYCDSTAAMSFAVDNIGDGHATDPRLVVDLSPLDVSSSSFPVLGRRVLFARDGERCQRDPQRVARLLFVVQ